MVSLNDIRRFFAGDITLGEPLARHTRLGIGGPADFFVEPASREDLVRIVTYFRHAGMPFLILGRGGNILANDAGFRGAVIRLDPGLAAIVRGQDGTTLWAEGGATLSRLVDFCVRHGLRGTEGLAGVPGTVGGMLATAAREDLTIPVSEIEVLRGDVIVKTPFDPGTGAILRGPHGARDIVLAATLTLSTGDTSELLRARREQLFTRNAMHAINVANAGGAFKDPPGCTAGDLLAEAEQLGISKGNAVLSTRYPGLVENRGGASAADVLELVRLAQRAVRERRGILLESSLRLIGFTDDFVRDVA